MTHSKKKPSSTDKHAMKIKGLWAWGTDWFRLSYVNRYFRDFWTLTYRCNFPVGTGFDIQKSDYLCIVNPTPQAHHKLFDFQPQSEPAVSVISVCYENQLADTRNSACLWISLLSEIKLREVSFQILLKIFCLLVKSEIIPWMLFDTKKCIKYILKSHHSKVEPPSSQARWHNFYALKTITADKQIVY